MWVIDRMLPLVGNFAGLPQYQSGRLVGRGLRVDSRGVFAIADRTGGISLWTKGFRW